MGARIRNKGCGNRWLVRQAATRSALDAALRSFRNPCAVIRRPARGPARAQKGCARAAPMAEANLGPCAASLPDPCICLAPIDCVGGCLPGAPAPAVRCDRPAAPPFAPSRRECASPGHRLPLHARTSGNVCPRPAYFPAVAARARLCPAGQTVISHPSPARPCLRPATSRPAAPRTPARPTAAGQSMLGPMHGATHRRINVAQCRRPQDEALSSTGRPLASAEIARRGADASPGGSSAVAGGLYTYAVEYDKLLLLGRLTKKDTCVSVPHLAMFRRHGEKFEAALEALPQECSRLGRGKFNSRTFDAAAAEATFIGRTSMLYTDIGRTGSPRVARRLGAKMLEEALRGLEWAVAERGARGAAEPYTGGE